MNATIAGGLSARLGPRTGLTASIISKVGLPYTTGLILDLDGDKAGPLGSNVATWVDQSGNGNNATQAVIANQPVVVEGANGHLGVLFNGVSSFMALSDFSELTEAQIFIVWKDSIDGHGNGIFQFNTNSVGATYLNYSGDGNLYDSFFTTPRNNSIPAIIPTGYNQYDAKSQTSSWSNFINGASIISTSSSFSAPTSSSCVIGVEPSSQLSFSGIIQRILLYMTVTGSHTPAIRSYLKSLYVTP